MFEVVTICDLVEVTPSLFRAQPQADADAPPASSFRDAVLAGVTKKYCFRVVPGRGLCVGVAALQGTGESRLTPGVASAFIGATFDLLFFMPRLDEKIRAVISKQDATGVFLSLHFFDSVFVPAHLLVDGSVFDAAKGVWQLEVDGGGVNTYRNDDDVLFAVQSVAAGADADGAGGGMTVIGSFVGGALGPSVWWFGNGGAADDEDAEKVDAAR
jgi:DNA-directed RNA polymerase subunit E'/Rpb7